MDGVDGTSGRGGGGDGGGLSNDESRWRKPTSRRSLDQTSRAVVPLTG